MSFIRRENLKTMPFIENILHNQIRDIINKIGVPIIIYQSLNTLTQYRGNDFLGYKKIKHRNHKLNIFLDLVKHLQLRKKVRDEKYKDQNKKIVKIIITKNNNILFVCEKIE